MVLVSLFRRQPREFLPASCWLYCYLLTISNIETNLSIYCLLHNHFLFFKNKESEKPGMPFGVSGVGRKNGDTIVVLEKVYEKVRTGFDKG